MHPPRTITNGRILFGLCVAGLCACGPAAKPEREVPLSAVKASVSINITVGETGGHQRNDGIARLTFSSIQDDAADHCNRLAKDVTADLNGVAVEVDPGGSYTSSGSVGGGGPLPSYQPAAAGCYDPSIDIPVPATGNPLATLHIKDESAEWTIAIDALRAQRMVLVQTPDGTFRAGSKIRAEASPDTDELGDTAQFEYAGRRTTLAITGIGSARQLTMPEVLDASGAPVEFTTDRANAAGLDAGIFTFTLHPHVATCEGPTGCDMSEVWVDTRIAPKPAK